MKWLGLAVLAAVLGVMTYGFLGMHVTSCGHSGRREDTNNLKNIAGLLLHGHSDRNLPLRDGALDVYLLVRNGWERKPDAEGRVLVGLSDGTVTTRR